MILYLEKEYNMVKGLETTSPENGKLNWASCQVTEDSWGKMSGCFQ